MRQRIAGPHVYGDVYVKVAITSDGELVSVVENLASLKSSDAGHKSTTARLLSAVPRRHYPGQPGQLGEVSSSENTAARLEYARFYETHRQTRRRPVEEWPSWCGATVGDLDAHQSVVAHHRGWQGTPPFRRAKMWPGDSYNVFTNQPLLTPQVIVNGPGTGNAESTIGWITSNTTAQQRRCISTAIRQCRRCRWTPRGTAAPPVTSSPPPPYPSCRPQRRTTMVAVGNLFFLNNVVHDKLVSPTSGSPPRRRGTSRRVSAAVALATIQ